MGRGGIDRNLSKSEFHVSLNKPTETMSVHTELYPDIEPFESGMLKVSDIHQVYWEQSGNKNGNPVIFLHGGPGSCTGPMDRTLFDPAVYRIILMDQRGAGKSLPATELRENTTWHLVADIETLRAHLGIDKWVVFGGSWGSTLSLIYAETHPDRVKALIIRGIFTASRNEMTWFNKPGTGASMLFPEYWEVYVKPIPEGERFDMMNAYYRRLTGSDETVKLECAKAWCKWESATCCLRMDPSKIDRSEVDDLTLQCAIIECHYFVNGVFLESDGQILDNIDRIRHIPTTIIQGRYDIVCPMETAWKIHRAFPEADFHILPSAGHSFSDEGIKTKVIEACEKYKNL